jgi:succinyl-diaminopimelate desuccinylase
MLATDGPDQVVELDLTSDVVSLTQHLCDIASVSGNEGPIADAVERALHRCSHLSVCRDENAIVARTDFGHPERVIIAGHLDTVPIASNVPSHIEAYSRVSL